MYPRYPGYLPFPTALQRAPGPVPNRNAIDNGQGNFLPEYLPAGSASFIPYNMNPTKYKFMSPDTPMVLFAGVDADSHEHHAPSEQNTGIVPATQPAMQFSMYVLTTAANLQKLPPSQASQAVNSLITEANILTDNMSALTSSSDVEIAKNRIAILHQIVYVATSVSPEVLNAAIAAKSIADFILMRDSAEAVKSRLNIHSTAMRNPRISEQDIAESALRVDAIEALLLSAKTARKQVKKRDIKKLEKALVDADLEHIRLKLKFIQQSREDVSDIAEKALNVMKAPSLDVEIVGLVKALPESTILDDQKVRFMPEIVTAAKQEILRKLATTKDMSKSHVAIMNTGSSCGCDGVGNTDAEAYASAQSNPASRIYDLRTYALQEEARTQKSTFVQPGTLALLAVGIGLSGAATAYMYMKESGKLISEADSYTKSLSNRNSNKILAVR